MSKSLKIKLLISSGILLKFFEKIFIFLTTFIFSIWSARLIGPESIGFYGIIVSILFFFETIIYNSQSTFYLQKNDPNNSLFFTFLFSSLVSGIFIFTVLNFVFFFVNLDLLFFDFSFYIRIISFRILFESINSIEKVYFIKNNKIIVQLFISFFSIILGIIFGYLLIINGYFFVGLFGNLIISSLTNLILSTSYILLISKPLKILTYDKTIFKISFKFGFVAMIDSLLSLIKRFFLGIFYSTSLLAFFQKGSQFPELVLNILSSTFSPIYASNTAKVLNEKQSHFILFNSFNSFFSLVTFPLLFILIGLGQDIIFVLLGNEWLYSYSFLVIISISLLFLPTQILSEISLKTYNSGSLFLSMSIIKRIFGLFIFFISIYFGFDYFLYGFIVYEFVSLLFSLILLSRLLTFSFFLVLKEIMINIIFSFPILLITSYLSRSLSQSLLNILLTSSISMIFYVLINLMFRKKFIVKLFSFIFQ
jgi:teichuronic acid exporter